MIRFNSWFKSRRLFWVLVLGIGIAAGLVAELWPRTPPAPVLVLSLARIPTPLTDYIYRFVPATPSWAWFWRAHDAVCGKRKPVNLCSEILALNPEPDPASFLPLGTPTFSGSNGLRVWLVGVEDLKRLRQRLEDAPGSEVINRPRVGAADEIHASMFTGSSLTLNGTSRQVGLNVDYYPRVHRTSTDLIAMATLSEAVTNFTNPRLPPVFVRTNLDLALRLQIPKGDGVFLLDTRRAQAGGKRIAWLLDPP